MDLPAAIDQRLDEVLTRLREMVGHAWAEPVRVHFDLRAKRRIGDATDFAATVTVHFPTGAKIAVAEGFGVDPWTIRSA